ncbi:alpha/beta hydrolase [Conexibacter sp. SYSU D00693]|uniref:alpha/beta hydrolase n=1 Tax=Conexibacter sp. SYSU D00693 TaxID=2812560 RepID=UPI00196B5035|nr:alpha/beta hydrolase [Conexibacter sp. SYSU D00693]
MLQSLLPSPEKLSDAAANAFDKVFRGGVADLRRTPARIIDEAPKRTIYRYLAREDRERALPVLLVPPLAAPTICFDLRRGCSMAEHLLSLGHPTYLLEYGSIAFSDRELGLEHWVEDVIPTAIERVSEDAGGKPVQLVGWCLGGIMSLLALAARPDLPVNSVATVASPFDFTGVRLLAPIRGAASITNGMLLTGVYRALGGAPAPLVRRAFQLTSIDKHLMKPWAILTHLDDRDFLAHVEAVDHFMAHMHAYPGRTMGQLYHQFFRVNELAGGALRLGDHTIDLAEVQVPVLSVAGTTDVLAPRPAVHAVRDLLTGAPEVRLETAPGGHLGVLTGRNAARTTWRAIDDFFAAHEPKREQRHLRVVA